MGIENPKMLAFKVFMMVVLPLGCFLPIWVVLSPGDAGQAALAFFMVFPYMIYPVCWSLGSVFDVWDEAEWFPGGEALVVGAFGGFLLPVTVLLPVYFSVPMAVVAKDVVLGSAIALLVLWVPLLAGLFFTAAVQERIALFGIRGSKRAKATSPDIDQASATQSGELQADTVALFFFLAVPLGFFIPLYIGVDHTVEGEAAMVFFMLLSNLAALQWRIGYRGSILLYATLKPDVRIPGNRRATLDKAEAILKLVYGCSVLPMAILLPLYLHAKLELEPRRMLAFFTLMLPPAYLLEALRVSHRHDRPNLPVKIAGAYFGWCMPVGILLPTWLASEPDGIGECFLLGFMMAPVALCLLVSLCFTMTEDGARLPFYPLDAMLHERGPTSDLIYTFVVVLLPAVILGPVWASGEVQGDLATMVVYCFIGILCGLLGLLFGISWYRRDSHGIRDAGDNNVLDLPYAATSDVLDLPYAATSDALRSARAEDLMSKGDAKFISNKFAFQNQNWSPMVNQPRQEPGKKGEYISVETDPVPYQNLSPDHQWEGWQPGDHCKAPWPQDEQLYEAVVVSVDRLASTAVVSFDGYEDEETTVALIELYKGTDGEEFDSVDEMQA